MKTIYDIYEHLYNSILGDMEDTMSRMETDTAKILNTRKELLIKILTLAGRLNKNENLILRDILKTVFDNGRFKFVLCQLPNKIRNLLIVASNKKLKREDFTEFPDNQKEYDFSCNMEFLGIERNNPNLKELINQAKEQPGTHIKGKSYTIVRLGDAIFIYDRRLLYYYTIEGQLIRIVVRACEYGSNTQIRQYE